MITRGELDIYHVDAFTDAPFGGNPASVVLGADRLEEEMLHKIAREMNTRETVFVMQSKIASFQFRYFTPKSEIGFSGHPTIAAFHALLREGLIEAVKDVTMVTLETKVGLLDIEIVKNEFTGRHEIQITHRKPIFLETYDPKDYLEALGLSLADFHSPNPIQTVSTGTPHLILPVSTMRALDRIKPNWDQLKELQRNSDYVSLSVFTRETRDPTSDAQVRHFAPALGVYEDPVSGSAAGSLGSYLIRYGFMEPTQPVTSIVIEQGHYVGRPGKIYVEVRGTQESIDQVKVSGTGVMIFKGTLYY
ncbi:PhzF family phenazine biosynthesis protein [Candidatus Thorarchaeota archaeon]|nr:MAG: PhzF family phenazine biosynthesis protein [Candidatus Thorarchaeota archaeon]